MRRITASTRSVARSPIGVFGIVLGSVFLVETAIMLVGVSEADRFSFRSIAAAFADAVVLTIVIAPVIWLLVVMPLRSLHAQRGQLLSRVLQAQEQERASLARDLHDELGQHLTAILLSLRAAEQSETPQESKERLETARRLASGSLDAVRRLARGLSPVVLNDLGLRTATERLCEDISAAAKIEIDRNIDLPDQRLRPAVEIGVFRVLQEALTNALRHSGATRLCVTLRMEDNSLCLEVRDNGRGLPAKDGESSVVGSGLGVQGMQERIALLGGRLDLTSGSGGTAMIASIPDAREQP